MTNYCVLKRAICTVILSLASLVCLAAEAQEPQVYFLHNDHLGTPRVVTDSTNKIVWQNEGEPFGNALPNEDPGNTGTPFTLNLRFPGQYYDKETGRNQNYYRDYNPETGRYVQSDPIGLRGGVNTFAYVEGNPVGATDPEGLLTNMMDPQGTRARQLDGAGSGGSAITAVASSLTGAAVGNALTRNLNAQSRDIHWPDRTAGKWSCKARADCNDNIPGNCPDDPKQRFSFGGGVANVLGTARNIAKANATSNLQCQPKHVSCKCTDPKGSHAYSGGC